MAEDSNTFLVIDGVPVEDVEADDYSAYEEEYSVSERMISSRRVEELGAVYWVVEVNYSAINIDTLAALQAQLRTRPGASALFSAQHRRDGHGVRSIPPDRPAEALTAQLARWRRARLAWRYPPL